MATEARGRGITLIGVLLVGIVLGVIGGFLLDGGDNEANETPSPSAPGARGPGPHDELNGVPVGYARTEEGAVAAAANFTLLTAKDSLLDQDALVLAMETLAAPSWVSEAQMQARNGYKFITSRYGNDANIAGAVLRYDVANFSSDQATIKLWAVSVASGSKRPNVEEVWSILSVDLEWANGDWRVTGSESEPGPAPIDLPGGAPQQSALDVMEGFDEFEGALVP